MDLLILSKLLIFMSTTPLDTNNCWVIVFLFDVSQEENTNYNLVCSIQSYRAAQLPSNRSVENVLMDIWPADYRDYREYHLTRNHFSEEQTQPHWYTLYYTHLTPTTFHLSALGQPGRLNKTQNVNLLMCMEALR